jgi:hypothetical protein
VLVVLLSKLVGLALFLALGGLVYWVASSPEFSASRVSIAGNRLMTAGELEAVASVSGVNLFWLRPAELGQRLRLLPPVESANVSLELPDHVLIEVKEREPVAIWLAGDTPFLVDRDGLLLAARPAARPLTMIRDVSNQALAPGSRVNVDAVRNISVLENLLAQTFGPQPRQYEYAHESGINVIQAIGPRLVIGATDDLEWKIGAIQAIVRHLEANRVSAQLIDVRFADRPYFR